MTIDHEDDTERDYFRDADPGDVETPDDDEAEPINDLGAANWHLRKIGDAIRQRNELAAVYDAEMERLRLRWMTRLARIEAVIAWHEAPLRSYAAMRLAADGMKTLELPHGTIRSRTPSKPTVTVEDYQAVMAWGRDVLPDVVETFERVNKRALNAYVMASGEIPPGCTVTPPETTFTITPEGGADVA